MFLEEYLHLRGSSEFSKGNAKFPGPTYGHSDKYYLVSIISYHISEIHIVE